MTITKTLSCHPHFNLGVFDSQITLRAFSHLAQTLEPPRTDSGLSQRRGTLQFWFHIEEFFLNCRLSVQSVQFLYVCKTLRHQVYPFAHFYYALFGTNTEQVKKITFWEYKKIFSHADQHNMCIFMMVSLQCYYFTELNTVLHSLKSLV